ncbi:MAG: hypothetical protein ACPGO5_02375 [Patescibacteria group bacterium]
MKNENSRFLIGRVTTVKGIGITTNDEGIKKIEYFKRKDNNQRKERRKQSRKKTTKLKRTKP